jgi:hypothetical protein
MTFDTPQPIMAKLASDYTVLIDSFALDRPIGVFGAWPAVIIPVMCIDTLIDGVMLKKFEWTKHGLVVKHIKI